MDVTRLIFQRCWQSPTRSSESLTQYFPSIRLASFSSGWHMRIPAFRAIVIIAWLLLAISYFLPDYLVPNDPSLVRLTRYDGYGAILRGNLFFVLPLWLTLFAIVGLVFFQNWGRYLYLVSVAYSLATSLLLGYSVASPLESFLAYLAVLLEGSILTLCFLSPFASYFARPRHP
jgi:hypothetical protein